MLREKGVVDDLFRGALRIGIRHPNQPGPQADWSHGIVQPVSQVLPEKVLFPGRAALPLLGGALGGALVGKLLDKGVDQNFVKEVSEELKPGSSAIFFIIRDANVDATLASLRQYRGKVLQTSLPGDAEETLRKELEGRTW